MRAVLRAEKLKGATRVLVAARHNKRELQAEVGCSHSIDGSLSVLNECLVGPPLAAEVFDQAKLLMARANVGRLRKDAVRAIEFVVSLQANHGIDDRAFFRETTVWLGERFGGPDNVLCADVHRDERQPHLHVLILPLIGGRMAGSDALGGPSKLRQLHQDYFAEISKRYGLMPGKPRLQGSAKTVGVRQVMEKLRATSDVVLGSPVWSAVRDHIHRDPSPYMTALSIEPPCSRKPRARSMADIFTSRGSGPKVEDGHWSPLDPYGVRKA